MNRYKTKKVKLGWIGLFQTSLNWHNVFQLHWCFIRSKLHPATEFGFTLFGFVLTHINRHRSLISFRWYTWDEKPAGILSVSVFYLPDLSFRIGNGKTWFWVRCENYAFYKSKKSFKDWLAQ
jgi:hypothetical protein